jgi:signal transduction histidine kinase
LFRLLNTSSLRVRFAVGFSVLVTIVLAIALVFIYISFADFRKEEFYTRLKNKALTTFRLLVEVEQIDHDLLQVIDKNTLNSLNDEKVMIYKDSSLIYNSISAHNIDYITDLFTQARKKGEYETVQGEQEVIALYIEQNTGKYIILASAFDKYGKSKMNFLKLLMIAVYFCGLIIGWITIYFFVKKVIYPLERLKNSLTNINYTNLDARLPVKGQGNEVDSLSITFNELLSRLQQAFNFQKDFVHYASHELRTPLATMVSLTENSLNKTLTSDETKEVLKELFYQQKNLTNITNSLLVLSDYKGNSNNIEYPEIRLDELVFRSVEIIKNIYPDADIAVNLEGDLANESSLLVQANEPLILMAFNNLLKNAIQYSVDKKVSITINTIEEVKEITFQNAGNPLSEEESERIFTPFYRGSNATPVRGYGLGLPLVKQIVLHHKASITYSYKGGLNGFKIVFHA